MKPARLGVIGCGSFARFALGAVTPSPLVTLVAAADPREECRLELIRAWREGRLSAEERLRAEGRPSAEGRLLIEETASGGQIRAYRHGAELCADPAVDLVWILAPPYLHYPLAKMALERGKAVFLEKPGSMRPEELGELALLALKQGVPASVDFVLRRTPISEAIHQLISSQALGPPEYLALENVAHDERLPEGHWFWDPALSGGIFVEHGVHFFDLVNWWCGGGEVKGALALRRARWKAAPVDRVVCLCLHGPASSPVVATYYHSFTTVERFERARWRLVLHRGFLDVEGWIPTAIRGEALVSAEEAAWLQRLPGCRLEALDRPAPDRDPGWRGEEAPLRYRARLGAETPDRTTLYRAAIRSGLEDLASCLVQPGRQPAVTLEDARRALELAVRATSLAAS